MFDRTIEPDPRPAAPQSRATYRMRDGHRREHAASRDRGSISFRDRSERALADVGIYGAVSVRDLAETHFGGHPYTTRRAVNAWIREGLAQGNPSHRTQRQPVQGADPHAERRGRGSEAGRRTGDGSRPGDPVRAYPARRSRARHRHLSGLSAGAPTPARAGCHRPARAPRRRAQERGRAPERVRAGERGRRAADAERHRVARELGLPVDARGRVPYPDAQIEYVDADGRTGRINIEVASGNYRAPSVRAKAAAGFVLHANGPAAARLLRSLGVGDGGDRSSLRGPTDRDPAAIEL